MTQDTITDLEIIRDKIESLFPHTYGPTRLNLDYAQTCVAAALYAAKSEILNTQPTERKP